MVWRSARPASDRRDRGESSTRKPPAVQGRGLCRGVIREGARGVRCGGEGGGLGVGRRAGWLGGSRAGWLGPAARAARCRARRVTRGEACEAGRLCRCRSCEAARCGAPGGPVGGMRGLSPGRAGRSVLAWQWVRREAWGGPGVRRAGWLGSTRSGGPASVEPSGSAGVVPGARSAAGEAPIPAGVRRARWSVQSRRTARCRVHLVTRCDACRATRSEPVRVGGPVSAAQGRPARVLSAGHPTWRRSSCPARPGGLPGGGRATPLGPTRCPAARRRSCRAGRCASCRTASPQPLQAAPSRPVVPGEPA